MTTADPADSAIGRLTPSEIFDLCRGGQDGCALCPRAGTASAKPSPITAPH